MKLIRVLACAGAVPASAWSLRKSTGAPSARNAEEVKAAELEKMLLGMASKKDSSTTSNDFVTALTPIMSSMETEINASHAAAQLILNNLTTAVSTCTSSQSTGNSQAAAKLATVTNAASEHSTCRTDEGTTATTYDSCSSSQSALESAKTTSCDSYGDVDILANINEVPAPNNGEYRRDWLPRVKTWVDAQILSLNTKKTSCETSTATWTAKVAECGGTDGNGGKKGLWTQKKSDCDTKQSTLESATCNYADKVQDVCDDFATCFNITKTQWDNQVPNLQAEEETRHREWWMIQRIRCYLNVLQAAGAAAVDAAAMTACQNAGHDSSFLNLTYPTMPAAPGACSSVNTPCDTAYITDRYGNLPSNAPAKACTPCVPATTTTMTTTTTPGTTVAPVPAGVNLPPGWPKVVGQGSWYGQPGVKLSADGSCNGNYVWSAYNMLYGCTNSGTTSWLPADCGYRDDCPDKMWFTFDLGAVHQLQNIKVWPEGLGASYRSNVYEILISTTSAGPVGPYSVPFPAFSTTSQGFTQVVHNDCGTNCNREIEHVINQQARYVMFHAIEWNNGNDKLRSAGVKYMTATVAGGL